MSATSLLSAPDRAGRVPVRVDARGQSSAPRTRVRGAGTVLGAAAFLVLAACNDSAVPFYDAPTSVPNSTTGIQDAVSGLFSETRTDAATYVTLASSFGRDIFQFNGASPGTFGPPAGLNPLSSAGPLGVWDNEYQQVRQANAIIASLSHVAGYTAQQTAAVAGVVQTIKALNFMMIAETHDTLGIPLYAVGSNPVDPPHCNKDVWAYIVALLDSGFSDLNAAGTIPLPVQVPQGFASVGQSAAPSTAPGSFAAFNRALAGKAGLEYAYAIARNAAGTHPTPTTPGAPDVTAMTRADSALTASALYDPSVIAPPAAGNFALDPNGVYQTFSGQSSDQPNGIQVAFFSYDVLFDLQFDVDTAHDLRWRNKFVPDAQTVQLSQYAGTSDGENYLPYATVNSPIPIVRAEELALVRAQIQLGLGNLATAAGLINTVHTLAGGMSALTIPLTYTAVRDTLLKEQRISTVFEQSGDRMIALRMYGLEAVADTTWQAHAGPDATVDGGLGHPTDYHTTVAAIPIQELSSRGGQYNLTCQ